MTSARLGKRSNSYRNEPLRLNFIDKGHID
jgi:hypothetical protein